MIDGRKGLARTAKADLVGKCTLVARSSHARMIAVTQSSKSIPVCLGFKGSPMQVWFWVFIAWLRISVFTLGGHTTVIVTGFCSFRACCSITKESKNPLTANFAAQYADLSGSPISPDIDETTKICPPELTKCCHACFVQ